MTLSAVVLIGLGALVAPQDPTPFVVDRDVTPPRVSADRDAITAYQALAELGKAMGWSVIPETDRMRDDLDQVSVDLSFEDQDPRLIAQLIAGSGGADVVFDDRSGAEGGRPVLHVISAPDPGTEAGRQRLRERSTQWYQAFLADELKVDKLVVQHAMRVRMHVGQLMMEGGEFEGAARYFKQIYDQDRSHDYVPTALLRMTEALFEMEDYESAEHWARELMRSHPSLPETAKATVLLGRTLLATGRYDACRQAMEYSLLRLSDSAEIIDLYLLVGEAERRLDWPVHVLDHMEILAAAHPPETLGYRQFLDFNFLYGFGALGVGNHEAAMQALELFLLRCRDDPRKGEAFVMLGKAYLALDRYLEARAAVLEARALQDTMSEEVLTEMRKLYARTSLAVGDKEAAFRELELEVRRAADPDLTLFLVEEFLGEQRFQRAIATAELLTDEDTPDGDRARYLKVVAMWRQALQTKTIDDFPRRAIELAKAIVDPELQSAVAEIIGRAYEEVGDLERASDAYRGILR